MSKDLFRLDAKKTTNFTEQKSFVPEGIYKPSTKTAKDAREGYSSIIRLLPNFTQKKEVEDNAIRITTFYVNIEEYPELNGKIFSKTNFAEKCPLGTLYKRLKDSKSSEDNDKCDLFKKSTKYYSYILVIEDENAPDLEGKVLIWEFGIKIKEKIDIEMKGKNRKKESCNVYDLAVGKDLQILITGAGQMTNYDKCVFVEQPSPIFLKGKGVIPTEEDEDGRVIIAQDMQEPLVKFLLKRKKNLEELAPIPWDDEMVDKVNQVMEYLNGSTPIASAKQSIKQVSSKRTVVIDDEDDADAPVEKPKATAKASTKVNTSTAKATMTANQFFGDLDDEDDE
jgi:hypothetical protein